MLDALAPQSKALPSRTPRSAGYRAKVNHRPTPSPPSDAVSRRSTRTPRARMAESVSRCIAFLSRHTHSGAANRSILPATTTGAQKCIHCGRDLQAVSASPGRRRAELSHASGNPSIAARSRLPPPIRRWSILWLGDAGTGCQATEAAADVRWLRDLDPAPGQRLHVIVGCACTAPCPWPSLRPRCCSSRARPAPECLSARAHNASASYPSLGSWPCNGVVGPFSGASHAAFSILASDRGPATMRKVP